MGYIKVHDPYFGLYAGIAISCSFHTDLFCLFLAALVDKSNREAA